MKEMERISFAKEEGLWRTEAKSRGVRPGVIALQPSVLTRRLPLLRPTLPFLSLPSSPVFSFICFRFRFHAFPSFPPKSSSSFYSLSSFRFSGFSLSPLSSPSFLIFLYVSLSAFYSFPPLLPYFPSHFLFSWSFLSLLSSDL